MFSKRLIIEQIYALVTTLLNSIHIPATVADGENSVYGKQRQHYIGDYDVS